MLEIYHIESMGLLDGPGVRTVIFLQGCPLKCNYCHNPDSWQPGQGIYKSVDQIVNLVLRYKDYYGEHGGVTFSGGEPLMQAKALLTCVKALKEHDIHLALDTSGAIDTDETRQLIDAVDLVILDIKASDEKTFKWITGSSSQASFNTLDYLKETDKPYWIRQVVLPGINDKKEDENALNDFTGHISRQNIERLPYHSLGLEKWQPWQLKYRKTYED